MNINANLAQQIINASMVVKGSQSVNEIGGEAKCIDSAGKWFMLEWFHGETTVTTLENIDTARHLWIGASESNTVTL